MDLNKQWSEYHKYYEELGEICNRQKEKTRKIKKVYKNDYIIEYVEEIGYCQKELGSFEIKEKMYTCKLFLKDKDDKTIYLHKTIEGNYCKKDEVKKLADKQFKYYMSIAY